MNGWLKFLIATACVVIIAGGGYFAWSEYQSNKAIEQARKNQKEASLRFECRAMVADLGKGKTKDYTGGHVATCINGGYVTEMDFQSVNAIQYVDQVRALITTSPSREARLTQAECIRMAKETLPEKAGDPVRTTKYNADLSKCDDLKRFDANWRQALDLAGVF